MRQWRDRKLRQRICGERRAEPLIRVASLGRALIDAKGMFWPWFIHFLQDSLILLDGHRSDHSTRALIAANALGRTGHRAGVIDPSNRCRLHEGPLAIRTVKRQFRNVERIPLSDCPRSTRSSYRQLQNGRQAGSYAVSDNGCETALASPWRESAPDAGKGKLTT